MKNLFFLLSLFFTTSFMLSNSVSTTAEPLLTKFVIGNIEIQNLDSGNYLFKRIDCDGGSYSFFSPFYEYPKLLNSVVSTSLEGSRIHATVVTREDQSQLTIGNIEIDEDYNKATLDVHKSGIVYQATLFGINLSKQFILDSFGGLLQEPVLSQDDCPVCVIVVVAAAVTICESAQSACTPCNGNLTVGACSCSCEVQQQQ